MISVRGLTKRYGDVRAVDNLTFDVAAGKVTGFLGPNGAGKSTTMRMVMGLDRPTAGIATVNAKRYVELAAPLSEVGALLDAGAMHPGRTGRAHLRIGARTNGICLTRVEQVIDEVLLFDELVNGLDLDGVRWIRALLRGFADEGRTVLVSPATEIGDLAHSRGVPVHQLAEGEQSLQHAYLSLTEESVDYHAHPRLQHALPDLRRRSPRRHDRCIVAAHPRDVGCHSVRRRRLAPAAHRREPLTETQRSSS